MFDLLAKTKGEKVEPLALNTIKAGSLGDIEALLIAAQHSKQEEKSDLYASAINFAVKFVATLKSTMNLLQLLNKSNKTCIIRNF